MAQAVRVDEGETTTDILVFGGADCTPKPSPAPTAAPTAPTTAPTAPTTAPTPSQGSLTAINSPAPVPAALGGKSGLLAGCAVHGDLWLYDTTTDNWAELAKPDMNASWPTGRAFHSFEYYPAGGYYLLYGGLGDDGTILSDVWRLQPPAVANNSSWSWHEVSYSPGVGQKTAPVARYGHAVAMFQSAGNPFQMFVMMGVAEGNVVTAECQQYVPDPNAVDGYGWNSFDATGGTYQPTPTARAFHTVLVAPSNPAVSPASSMGVSLYGGSTSPERPYDCVEALPEIFYALHGHAFQVLSQYYNQLPNPRGLRSMHAAASNQETTDEIFREWVYGGACNSTAGSNTLDSPALLWYRWSPNHQGYPTQGPGIESWFNTSTVYGSRVEAKGGCTQWQHDNSTAADPQCIRLNVVGGTQNANASQDDLNVGSGSTDQWPVGVNASLEMALGAEGNQWELVGASPNEIVAGLFGHSMVPTQNGTLLAFGGTESSTMEPNGVTYALAPGAAAWEVVAGSAFALTGHRLDHCAVVISTMVQNGTVMGPERMLVLGGSDPNCGASTCPMGIALPVSGAEEMTWSSLPQGQGEPAYRFGQSCVFSYPEVIMFGGGQITVGPTLPNNDLWSYNVETQSWTQQTACQGSYAGFNLFTRAFHSATLMLNPQYGTQMLLFGGVTWGPAAICSLNGTTALDSSLDPDPDPTPSSSYYSLPVVDVLDFTPGKWADCRWLEVVPKCGPMPGRSRHTQVQIANSKALMIGGQESDGTLPTTLWEVTLAKVAPPPRPPPSPTPGPTPNTDDGLQLNKLTKIIVAGVVGLGIVVALVVVVNKYNRRRLNKIQYNGLLDALAEESEQDRPMRRGFAHSGTRVQDTTDWEAEFRSHIINDDHFAIKFEDLQLVRQIGHGATCVVHAGWWKDGSTPVAVKRFFCGRGQHFTFEDFCRETLTHKKLKHKNVLSLVALCVDPPCSVTEFLPNGTVYHLLGGEAPLTLGACLKLATGTAEGMEYLHHNGVLHRDLKTLNLLLDETGNVKVCDFGISRFQANTMGLGVGSIQYMAPEVFVSGHYTEKADVYSFAIILWELLTREAPHGEEALPFMVMSDVRGGKRLPIPSMTPPAYADLLTQCWHHDPNSRPHFSIILSQLEAMRQDPTIKAIPVILKEGATPRASKAELAERSSFTELPSPSSANLLSFTGSGGSAYGSGGSAYGSASPVTPRAP